MACSIHAVVREPHKELRKHIYYVGRSQESEWPENNKSLSRAKAARSEEKDAGCHLYWNTNTGRRRERN